MFLNVHYCSGLTPFLSSQGRKAQAQVWHGSRSRGNRLKLSDETTLKGEEYSFVMGVIMSCQLARGKWGGCLVFFGRRRHGGFFQQLDAFIAMPGFLKSRQELAECRAHKAKSGLKFIKTNNGVVLQRAQHSVQSSHDLCWQAKASKCMWGHIAAVNITKHAESSTNVAVGCLGIAVAREIKEEESFKSLALTKQPLSKVLALPM